LDKEEKKEETLNGHLRKILKSRKKLRERRVRGRKKKKVPGSKYGCVSEVLVVSLGVFSVLLYTLNS